MLATPNASSSHLLAPEERVVRFDDQCILIPQPPSNRPRIATKSYSLPLWKKKPSSSDEEREDHVILKVVVPSFKPKARPDTQRLQPLSPCLVHRDPASPTRSSTIPSTIHPLTPTSPSPTRGRSHCRTSYPPAQTVPLRACCPDCYHITEECLIQGDSWEEHFSCGARRRRSSSLEGRPPRTGVHHRFGSYNGATSSSGLAITVDEVDKRRREGLLPPRLFCDLSLSANGHEHDRSSSGSTSSRMSGGSDSDGGRIPLVCTAKTQMRIEDHENDLFPLPSPRRTPVSSPCASKDDLPAPVSSPFPQVHPSGLLTPEGSPQPPTTMPTPLRNLPGTPGMLRSRAESFSSAVLRAGADVLKGVSSINAQGIRL